MDQLTSRGPYSDDAYVPLGALPFLPEGGTVSHLRDYAYVSLQDAEGIERHLEAYFIGPDGRGYRLRQAVSYGEGDPADPDTERTPETLDGEVDDLGPMSGAQLTTLIHSDHPGLSRS